MVLLSREYVLRLLMNLQPTEEQMKTVGLYMRTFRKEAAALVDAWLFVYRRSSMYHRLNLLYLANEVVQTARDSDRDSVELKTGFKRAVNDVFAGTRDAAAGNAALHRKLCDLERVWEQRGIMAPEGRGGLEELVRSIEQAYGSRERLQAVLEDALARLRDADGHAQ